MSSRATRVWTEFRPRFAVVVAAVLCSGVLIGIEDGWNRVLLAVIVVTSISVSLARDGYFGVVVGLAGAGGLVVSKRLTGTFSAAEFFITVTELATVVTVAWVVGVLGNHLRVALARATRPVAGSVMPATGTMGVLGSALGSLRLEEEVVRRRTTGAPLALMLIDYREQGALLDAEASSPARRALARYVVSVVGDADVVFEAGPQSLGVILPNTDWVVALESLSRIAVAASDATYADVVDRTRRPVSSVMDLDIGVVVADDDTVDAAALLEAARRSLSPVGPSDRGAR